MWLQTIFPSGICASQTSGLPSREIRSNFPMGFVHLVFTSIIYRDLTLQLKIIVGPNENQKPICIAAVHPTLHRS